VEDLLGDHLVGPWVIPWGISGGIPQGVPLEIPWQIPRGISWVNSGSILVRSWIDSVSVLGSWIDSGLILCQFCSILDRFWIDSGQLLGWFWVDPESILARSCRCRLYGGAALPP
jgi:hypothetical protein